MNDVTNFVAGIGQIINLKNRQTEQATERDQEINYNFGNKDANFETSDKRGNEPEPGYHHRSVREQARRLCINRGEGTRGFARHRSVTPAQAFFIVVDSTCVPAARDEREERSIER